MEITTRLCDTGASELALSNLESKIGFVLPEDYRRFMIEFNGGRPVPSFFSFQTSNGPTDANVRYFLTLFDKGKHYTIPQYLDRYNERIPDGLLPIGCDSFGNLVLLDGGVKSTGAIYFWDHELESMDDPTWDNISFIASSFSEFANSLREAPIH